MENQDLNIFETGLNERSKAYLLETTRWTKFLAIIGFIFLGLFLIVAIALMTMGSVLSSQLAGMGSNFGNYMGIGMGLIYILIIALYIYPIVCLMQFSSKMKRGIHTNDSEMISEGFRCQKNMFKFIGIFTIVLLSFYLLMFVIGGIGAALAA